MPTVDEYREMLGRAMEANDAPAVKYFESQIKRGEAMPMPDEKAVPQGGSIMSPIAQGVTLGFADEIGGGASGLFNAITGKGTFKEGYEGTRDSLRESASQYAERNPATSFITELASGMLLPMGAARTVARGVGLGAGAGIVTGAGKNENPDHIGEDMGLGGVLGGLGGGIGQAAGGLFRAIVPRRAPRARGQEFQNDVRRLEQAGIHTTPGERLGSSSARRAEQQTDAYLGTGEEIATRPNQLRTQIMGRVPGFRAEDVENGELSDAALSHARDYFRGEYDSILNGQHVDIGDMDPRLAAIETRFTRQMLDHEQKREVREVLDSFRDNIAAHQTATGGNINTVISGEAYKRMRSNLGKRARQLARQTGPNASLAPIYRDVQGALDDAFRANAPTDIARRLAETDRQYAHYAFLRDVARNPDDINAIANRVQQSGVDPDLQALVRAYQNVILRGGMPQGSAEASGHVLPPVMSMLKTAGARAASTTPAPQLPRFIGNRVRGTGAGVWGQGSSMVAQQSGESGNDAKRKAKRRRKYDDEHGAY